MFLLELTENSKQKIREICLNRNIYAVELGIKSGGCAGFEYEWRETKIDTSVIGDEVIDIDGGRLLVKAEAKAYLHGCKIDFVESLFAQVFDIENPNTTAACGCGVSLTFDQTTVDNNIEILELN